MAKPRAGRRPVDVVTCDDRAPVAPTRVARPVGRPREIEGPGVSLSVWLPTSVYDWLGRESGRRNQSVSRYVRDVLTLLANVRDRPLSN